MVLDIRRDRNGTIDPMLITRYRRRFSEFDHKIVSMHARGMTTRKIQGHLEAIHGVEASPGLISAITDAVTGAIMEEVAAWQNRSLGPLLSDRCHGRDRDRYPDRRGGREPGGVALAVLPDGTRDVPGPWFHANEGARFRARVLSELRNPIVGKQSPGSFPDPPHTFQRSRSPSWTG